MICYFCKLRCKVTLFFRIGQTFQAFLKPAAGLLRSFRGTSSVFSLFQGRAMRHYDLRAEPCRRKIILRPESRCASHWQMRPNSNGKRPVSQAETGRLERQDAPFYGQRRRFSRNGGAFVKKRCRHAVAHYGWRQPHRRGPRLQPKIKWLAASCLSAKSITFARR